MGAIAIVPCYQDARGRYAPRRRVEDQLRAKSSVVSGKPSASDFINQIAREMRIRFYQPKTISNYRTALRNLLSWFGQPPHRLTRDDVREYLSFLVDAGVGSSWVGVNLSAIRTAFDKMCCRDLTLGLVTPRRAKRLPVVLSREEAKRLVECAPSLRDTLIIGLLYGMGLRVSELARLRFSDFDFDRELVRVYQGKGRKDRQVVLPVAFASILRERAKHHKGDAYVFPSRDPGRHISLRTVQRIVHRAASIAKINKHVTPHTLRHSFATHSFENGCDVRDIQKWLGHSSLETTTIYIRVAKPQERDIKTPIDELLRQPPIPRTQSPVGKLRLHLKPDPSASGEPRRCKVTISVSSADHPRTFLTGIVATEVRPGWIALSVPPYEQWDEPLRWLTRSQRERIESPEFFELLQREIPKRFESQFQ